MSKIENETEQPIEEVIDYKTLKGLARIKAFFKQPKVSKISNIIFTCLEVAIVVVTIGISIFVWVGHTDPNDATQPKSGKTTMLAIQTDSMIGDREDNFNPGDLIFVKMTEDYNNLQEGAVVAYYSVVIQNGNRLQTIVTHRIEKVNRNEYGTVISYEMAADNTVGATESDVENNKDIIGMSAIVGVYQSKLKGVGGIILWLQGYEKVENTRGVKVWNYAGNTNNFLYVIIIPLIVLLLWNGYYLIKMFVDAKIKKTKEAAAQAAVAAANAAINEEEIKRRAIEEYIAKMQAEKLAQETRDSSNLAPEETKSENSDN